MEARWWTNSATKETFEQKRRNLMGSEYKTAIDWEALQIEAEVFDATEGHPNLREGDLMDEEILRRLIAREAANNMEKDLTNGES